MVGMFHTLTIAGIGLVVLNVAFVVLCLAMILTILIQRPKGGGLSGAFGGAGGGGQSNIMGPKVGDILTVVTVVMFVLFLGLGMGLVWTTRSVHNEAMDTQVDVTDESGMGSAETPDTGGDADGGTGGTGSETPDEPAN